MMLLTTELQAPFLKIHRALGTMQTVSGGPAGKQGNIDPGVRERTVVGRWAGRESVRKAGLWSEREDKGQKTGWHRDSQESGTLVCKPTHLTNLKMKGQTCG